MKDGYTVAMVESDLWGYPGIRVNYPKLASMPQALFSKSPKHWFKAPILYAKSEKKKNTSKNFGNARISMEGVYRRAQGYRSRRQRHCLQARPPSVIKDTSWIKPELAFGNGGTTGI
ncbi:MAG: hypothetical protein ACLUKN_03340 [Bacilli bacterium]